MDRPLRFCGIDVGSHAVHLACLTGGKAERPEWLTASAPAPGPWVDGCPAEAALARAVRAAAGALGGVRWGPRLWPTRAAVSLPTGALVVKVVNLPALSLRELRAALHLEIQRLRPDDPAEAVGDWLPLALPGGAETGQGGQGCLLLTARQAAVEAAARAARAARMRPVAVEPEPAVLFRLSRLLAAGARKPANGKEARGQAEARREQVSWGAFQAAVALRRVKAAWGKETPRTQAVARGEEAARGQEAARVLIDLGASGTRLVVTRGDALLLFRELPVGGSDLTAALAARRQVTPEEAEALKRTAYQEADSLADFGAAGERLVREVERSLRYVERQHRLEGYGALHLVGGGARWPLLRRELGRVVGVPAHESIALPAGAVPPEMAGAAALCLWKEGTP